MQNNKKKLENKLFRSILSLLPLIFWVLIILGFDSPYIGICTIISAVIHEAGHILMAKTISAGYSLSAVFSGFRIKGCKTISYKEEAIIAAAGPALNIAVFVLCLLLARNREGYTVTFGVLNLFTALSNLLPIHGYDGYRIIDCIFKIFGKSEIPFFILRAISFSFVIIFSFISLYLMARLDGGYWIYFIFVFSMIKFISGNKK